MSFVLSAHAEERLLERGITRQDIQYCMENHHISLEEAGGVQLYIAEHPNGKRIQVVKDTKNNLIVSVVWLE